MDSQQKGNIISDFVRQNLSPRPPERTRISKAYEFLSSVLPGKSFQTGSYARHTSTTPVHDLDVIFVLPETLRKSVVERRISPEELTVTDILQDLATALQKEYGEKAKVKVQPHSVGIFFQSNEGFSIDVVPAQPTNGEKFLVPETALRSVRARRALYESKQLGALRWIKSHPKGYIDQASRLDDVTNGYFRKTAKIVKKWKARSKELNNVFPLKSFHVEIVLTEIMKANPKSPFHSHLHSFFEALSAAIQVPQYQDLADSSRMIDEYIAGLSDQEKAIVLNERKRSLTLVSQLAEATTETRILKTLEDLLMLNGAPAPSVAVATAATPRVSHAFSKPYAGGG